MVREKLRTLRYAWRTEKNYVMWVEQFVRFSQRKDGSWRHPREMGGADVERFLTHLAVNRGVAAATQRQVMCALLFLYQHVLEIELPRLGNRTLVFWFRNQFCMTWVLVKGGGFWIVSFCET
ncbi:MAG: phage integrase N-terminal SAM-like domain-containing protein [Planctomycetaceae bacterium]